MRAQGRSVAPSNAQRNRIRDRGVLRSVAPKVRLLTLDQVAERLQLSRRTVERKIQEEEIPSLQLGGPRTAIRVDEAELEAWLSHRRRTP